MLDLPEIRRLLTDRNISEVARRVRISRQQLTKIANGETENPGLRTIRKISEYLEGKAE